MTLSEEDDSAIYNSHLKHTHLPIPNEIVMVMSHIIILYHLVYVFQRMRCGDVVWYVMYSCFRDYCKSGVHVECSIFLQYFVAG